MICILSYISASRRKYQTATNHLSSVPGQPPGAFLHPLSCPGRRRNIPATSQGGEDSREQAGARAEAQHHIPGLLQIRASGPLPPSGA